MIRRWLSPMECSGSGIVPAKVSAKMVLPSSNETLCFLRFARAFRGSHVKFIRRF